MKASRLILTLAASLAIGSVASVANAHNEGQNGYAQDSRGNAVKTTYGKCWRTGYWTPAMATEECDPDLVKKAEAPAAPAPAPVVPAGPEKPAFEKITLQAETLFDFDKAVVRDDGKKTLDEKVVAAMKQYPQVEVVLVTGHADRIGKDSYNQDLSQRRADAVKAYLTGQGVDAARVETAAKGEAEPVASCTDVKGKESGKNKALVECLQPNRRVVVEVKVQKPTQK
jgi:OmpA-OmpF porin, OOP family